MYEKQIEEIKKFTDEIPETAIVLGSGLGALADNIEITATVPYREITDMPVSTAPSHKGQFVFGKIGGKNVMLMQGRLHLYEDIHRVRLLCPFV